MNLLLDSFIFSRKVTDFFAQKRRNENEIIDFNNFFALNSLHFDYFVYLCRNKKKKLWQIKEH